MCLAILKTIRHAYKSKYNLNHKNQVSPLMNTDGENMHYFATKCFLY